MRWLVMIVAGMLLLPATAAASASQDTLRLLNAERANRGIAPLRWDARLARAARRHSRDLVARHYFDHVTLGGRGLRSRVARTGWTHRRTPWRLAENLAWGSGSLGTPAAIVQTWLNSPPHRRVMLDPRLRAVGIGIASGTPVSLPGATYTADFGG